VHLAYLNQITRFENAALGDDYSDVAVH